MAGVSNSTSSLHSVTPSLSQDPIPRPASPGIAGATASTISSAGDSYLDSKEMDEVISKLNQMTADVLAHNKCLRECSSKLARIETEYASHNDPNKFAEALSDLLKEEIPNRSVKRHIEELLREVTTETIPLITAVAQYEKDNDKDKFIAALEKLLKGEITPGLRESLEARYKDFAGKPFSRS